MVRCFCIDDKDQPDVIALPKRVKEGEQYRITDIDYLPHQKEFAFTLYEKPLDESCSPYDCWLSRRFAIAEEDLPAFFEFVESCNEIRSVDVQKVVDEAIKEGNLQLV